MTRRYITFVTALLLAVGLFAPAVLAGPSDDLLALINTERAGAGLAALSVDRTIAAHAPRHTEEMLAAGTSYHTADLRGVASGWSKLGENVGRGPTVASLHHSFMSSSGHKKNVLGDYTHIGVGTGVSEHGLVFATVVFMKKKGADTRAPATTTTTKPAPPVMNDPAPTNDLPRPPSMPSDDATVGPATEAFSPAPASSSAPSAPDLTTVPSVDHLLGKANSHYHPTLV